MFDGVTTNQCRYVSGVAGGAGAARSLYRQILRDTRCCAVTVGAVLGRPC
jgi:hypothetical protein